MRQAILKEAHFVGLLLHADKSQQRALLRTISKNQMRVLVEVIYNVLHGYGNITEKDKIYLKKYQSVIRRLVDKHTAARKRKNLLLKYFAIFRKLLQAIEKNITIQWLEN